MLDAFGVIEQTSTITIVIAEHRPISREGVRLILEKQPGFQVVGAVDDDIGAQMVVRELEPSVLVAWNSVDGLELIEKVLKNPPRKSRIGVVVLSDSSDKVDVQKALKAGAKGYVLTESSPEELVNAVQEAVKDEYYISPKISRGLIRQSIYEFINEADEEPSDTLTSREKKILRMLAKGYTNINIALLLKISCRTVETHRLNIRKKLGIHNRFDLICYALEKEMIQGIK